MAEEGVLEPLLPGESEPLLEPNEPAGVRERLVRRPDGQVADAEVGQCGDRREDDLTDELMPRPLVERIGAGRRRAQRPAAPGDRAARRLGRLAGRTVASDPGQ